MAVGQSRCRIENGKDLKERKSRSLAFVPICLKARKMGRNIMAKSKLCFSEVA